MSLLETAQRADDDGGIYLRLSPRVARPQGKGRACGLGAISRGAWAA